MLAEDVTTLVHGRDECQRVIAASRALFGQGVAGGPRRSRPSPPPWPRSVPSSSASGPVSRCPPVANLMASAGGRPLGIGGPARDHRGWRVPEQRAGNRGATRRRRRRTCCTAGSWCCAAASGPSAPSRSCPDEDFRRGEPGFGCSDLGTSRPLRAVCLNDLTMGPGTHTVLPVARNTGHAAGPLRPDGSRFPGGSTRSFLISGQPLMPSDRGSSRAQRGSPRTSGTVGVGSLTVGEGPETIRKPELTVR